MRFSHKQFFDGARGFLTGHGRKLTPERVSALEFLLTSFETDLKWSTDVRPIAYALATICVETDWTFRPIQEYGSRGYFERRYGHLTRKGRELGNDAAGEGAAYSGKGFVQLTGETNYEKLEDKLHALYPELIAEFETRNNEHFDLTDDPEQAKDPSLAFAIMTIGMFQGIYTGHKIGEYITPSKTNYAGARRVINGQDRAAEIAGYAREWEAILRSSAVAPASITPTHDELHAESADTPAANPAPQTEQPPISGQQVADQIINTASSDAPAIAAAAVSEPIAIAERQPTGFVGKFVAFVTLVVTGEKVLPSFLTDGSTLSNILSALLPVFQGIYVMRYWVIGGLTVWFVVVKAESLVMRLKAMDVNTDQTRGNVVLTQPVTKTWLERLTFWK